MERKSFEEKSGEIKKFLCLFTLPAGERHHTLRVFLSRPTVVCLFVVGEASPRTSARARAPPSSRACGKEQTSARVLGQPAQRWSASIARFCLKESRDARAGTGFLMSL